MIGRTFSVKFANDGMMIMPCPWVALDWRWYRQYLGYFAFHLFDYRLFHLCGHMQVEIDESYFFKRKYNHGRVTEGRWIVGGVARPPGQGYFLVPVANRNMATLHRIIQNWVMPGVPPALGAKYSTNLYGLVIYADSSTNVGSVFIRNPYLYG
ncbi:MAG: hypothetical protein GY820_25260 [Gammaproteobacteria bacterium]|nr:hypothetical protein [Gammaproteobacteria bacterium]